MRFAAHTGNRVNPSSAGMKKSRLIQVGWISGTALTVQGLSALVLDAIVGTQKEVWDHKDSVLCLQITPPALELVTRDLIAAFHLNSVMARALNHSVTLSFGVSSSS